MTLTAECDDYHLDTPMDVARVTRRRYTEVMWRLRTDANGATPPRWRTCSPPRCAQVRVSKRLRPPLDDRHSARRGTYRVLDRIDEARHRVTIAGVFE